MRPKLKLSTPALPEVLSKYDEIARKLPSWAVRSQVMSNYPRHLYNYLRFDSNATDSIRNVRTMLVDSNFYLTDPGSFNDPFEFKNRLVLDDDKTLRQFFEGIYRETHPNSVLSTGAMSALLDTMMRDIKADPPEIFGALFETHGHGVHCFTPDPKSQLMWSHYADSHRGICLQFRTSLDVPTFLAAGPVDYCDDFPDFHVPTAPQADTVAMMTRKGTVWSYEKERRITMLAINSRLLAFKPEALTGIILGSRFSDMHMPSIRQMLSERSERGLPSVRVYRAIAQPTAYMLSVRKLDSCPSIPRLSSGGIPWDLVFER